MNMKNNFSQAVKELLEGKNEEGVLSTDATPEKETAPAEASAPKAMPAAPQPSAPAAPQPSAPAAPAAPATPAPVAAAPAPAAAVPAPAPAPVVKPVAAAPAPSLGARMSAPTPRATPAQPARPTPSMRSTLSPENIPVTIIAQGTTIVGEIHAAGDVEMMGNLKGNLEGEENLKLCGKVIGNVKGKQIEMLQSVVHGDILSAADVVIDSASIVVGNINANSIVLGGKVKGNITVNTTATFSENALLIGNVEAAQLSVNSGAKLDGEISIKRDREEEAIFDEEFDI